jgi:hypothetical protein
MAVRAAATGSPPIIALTVRSLDSERDRCLRRQLEMATEAVIRYPRVLRAERSPAEGGGGG